MPSRSPSHGGIDGALTGIGRTCLERRGFPDCLGFRAGIDARSDVDSHVDVNSHAGFESCAGIDPNADFDSRPAESRKCAALTANVRCIF